MIIPLLIGLALRFPRPETREDTHACADFDKAPPRPMGPLRRIGGISDSGCWFSRQK